MRATASSRYGRGGDSPGGRGGILFLDEIMALEP